MDADRTRLLLKPEEAAEILAVGRTQLYALLASGQLQSVKIGQLRHVPLAACESYVLSLAAELPA